MADEYGTRARGDEGAAPDDGVEMTIELPEAPPDDLEAFVEQALGTLPVVHGPTRSLSDLQPVVVFLAEAFLAGLVGNRGDKALSTVFHHLRRRGDGRGRAVEVTVEGEGAVTFVFDGPVDDVAAVTAMSAAVDRGYPPGTRLRWHPDDRAWRPEDEAASRR
jgi:hypothetical protein